jgi:hypothetical protein
MIYRSIPSVSNAGSESFEIGGDRGYLTAALPVRKESARWRSHPGEPTMPKIAVDARVGTASAFAQRRNA